MTVENAFPFGQIARSECQPSVSADQNAIPAIRIRGLMKTFSAFQLGPLDLTVPCGTIYGLIGPNGAGKTTTIDLIMGMGAEDHGVIEVMGLDHRRNEAEVKRRIGYVSPDLSFTAWGRVGRLMAFLKPFYPTWDDDYCTKLLQRFGLGDGEKIATLSLGNKTRLALIAALSHRPELLILDEPTTGLDAVGKHQFYEELLALMQEERRTVLISSHNLTDLERFADYLGMIHKGKLLLEGPIDTLIDRFRMVDLRIANDFNPKSLPPQVRILRRESDRCRVLVDKSATAPMNCAGAEVIEETPLTLEELFVALVGEGQTE